MSEKMKKIVYPETLRGRMTQVILVFAGIIVLLFGVVSLYNWRANKKYDDIIYSMSLLNDYFEELDAAVLAQKGYLYYEGMSDYEEAEEAYALVENTLTSLEGMRVNKTCYYEIRNLRGMTESLRDAMKEMYEAMELYHNSEGIALEAVNEKYVAMRMVYRSIRSEYTDVNEKMLSYAEEVYDRVHRQRRISDIFLIVTTVIGGLILYGQIQKMNNSVLVPIQSLADYARKVQEGEFPEGLTVRVDMDRDMAMLTEVFQSMVKQLKEQIDTLENYIEVQRKLQESRFKELQMQINPHFMFNTLNMLTENAYLEHAETTSELLKVTAKMFRYSLDFSGRAVTLYQEMEELGNYVIIQEQRFGERIRFAFDLDERFHGIEVPALILQPLVENAVVHGVGNMLEGAVIRICTRYFAEEKRAQIVIEDNGKGMTEEELSKAETEMENYDIANSAKVGLGNVYMRLKWYYGERMEMSLQSEENRGTRVIIELKEVGEENVI